MRNWHAMRVGDSPSIILFFVLVAWLFSDTLLALHSGGLKQDHFEVRLCHKYSNLFMFHDDLTGCSRIAH